MSITAPRFVLALLLPAVLASASAPSDLARKFPEATAALPLVEGFPMLARFLALDHRWELPPGDLAAQLFPTQVKLVQGSEKYPLLFCGQRSAQWPGLPVWDQVAYETEYYAFDPARPVIRLHVGRPLDGGMQYIDYSQSDEAKALFPLLKDSVRQELADNIRKIVEALQPYGAKELPFRHPRIHAYLLPGGTKLTFSDFTGTGRGSVYLQIELEPVTRVASQEHGRLPAFPGAQGYGALTAGGRGGKVYVVTTLDDYLSERRDGRKEGTLGEPRRDGTVPVLPAYPDIPAEKVIPGSLREAVEASGPRIVVFAVSGTIELKYQLKIRNPYITIAGNTAPGEGVQIRNWGIEIMTHDVVLRYLRLRVGDIKGPGKMPRVLGDQTHALDISGLNIVVDHCEFAYANDQIVNIYAQRTPESRAAITFQWNYVCAGLTKSVHEGGNHSHACAIGGWGWASFHHNLAAFTLGRNPRLSGLRLDYRNNVLHYFWDSGYGDSTDDSLKLNYIANVLEHGQRREAFFDGMHFKSGQFYAAGNVIRNCKRKKTSRVLEVPPEIIMKTPFAAAPVDTRTAEEAYANVLRWGGASLPERDLITTYVAQCVRDDTGEPAGTTDDWPSAGYPVYKPAAPLPDNDHDGMPDEWEIRHKLNPHDALDASRDADADGYTNVEEYINGTDPTQYVDYRNPANNHDPRGP
jgi:pectate lyase